MPVISVLLVALVLILALTVCASVAVAVASFAPFFRRARARETTLAAAADVWSHADQSLRHGSTTWLYAIRRVRSVSSLATSDVELGITPFLSDAPLE